jgi:prophage tail gpP-like protein
LPSYFDVELTELYPGQAAKAVVSPGATCEVYLGSDKVMTGYIDRYLPHYDKDSHRVRIAGRSKTEDMTDCSVDTEKLTSWQITAKTIGEAARILVAPYGIAVKLPDGDADLPVVDHFPIFPGYTAYQLIEEMARAVAFLVWDDADGNLVLSRGGTGGRAGSALVEGQNIEMGDAAHTMDQRFSRYVVATVNQSAFDFHIPLAGRASDPQWPTGRGERFKFIPAEGELKPENLDIRAQWEANRRYGRSLQTILHVTGWRDANDKLWTPNTIVHVAAPNLKTEGERAIFEVSWMRDEQGTYTRITVMPAGALNPKPFFPIDRL